MDSKATNINFDLTTFDVINRAAKVAGESLSDFIIAAAVREAEMKLLDQQSITLEDDAFDKCARSLDRPQKQIDRLRQLLKSRAPWTQ